MASSSKNRTTRDPFDLMVVSLTGEYVETVEAVSDTVTIYRSPQGIAEVTERADDEGTIFLEVRTWVGTLVGQVEYHEDGHVEVVYA